MPYGRSLRPAAMVSTPRRISSLHAATPTNPAPPSTNALVNPLSPSGRGPGRGAWSTSVDIARGEFDVHPIQALEARGHLLRHRDRTMPAAGAAERDDQLRAAALAVVRQRIFQRAFQVVEQVLGRRLGEHEFAHARMASVERPQLIHPVRIVEQPYVDDPGRPFGDPALVAEGKAGDEHSLAGLELLCQLAELCDVDAVMRAVVAAAGLAVVRADVDEDVFDAALVGVFEHDGAVSAERQHPVGVVERREPARELESRVDENADRLVELWLAGAAHDHQRHRVSLSLLARRSGTPSATMSSTAASRIACTEPKCRSSARLRAGPMPSTESSGDVKAFRARTLRWWVMANRCASSRMRCTRNIPGEFLSCTMGSDRPGVKISSCSLARAKVGMSA